MPDLERINKLLKYVAAGIPYVGDSYAQYLNDKSSEELKSMLNDLKALSEEEKQALKASEDQLVRIKEVLNAFLKEKNDKTKLTVIVPAGGKGGSLFPVTQVMPKCLVTVGHKPMLQHIIDNFYRHPNLFKEVLVVTDNYSEAIEENIRQGGYNDFVKCIKIKSRTVPDALVQIKNSLPKGKPFLIHYSDVLIENCDWEHVYETYFVKLRRRKHVAMLLCSKYYPSPLGIGVITEGDTGILKNFSEKPEQLVGGDFANLAIAIFEYDIFDYLDPSDKGIFETTITKVIEAKRTVSLFKVDKWHHVQDLSTLYYLQNDADLQFLISRS